MRLQILERYPKANFRLFAVWEKALPTDSRRAWWKETFGNDPRVTSLWDANNVVGQWFAANGYNFGGLGSPFIFDAYFAYDKDATWKAAWPSSPVVDGNDIIASVDGLQKKFVPLLRRS